MDYSIPETNGIAIFFRPIESKAVQESLFGRLLDAGITGKKQIS